MKAKTMFQRVGWLASDGWFLLKLFARDWLGRRGSDRVTWAETSFFLRVRAAARLAATAAPGTVHIVDGRGC